MLSTRCLAENRGKEKEIAAEEIENESKVQGESIKILRSICNRIVKNQRIDGRVSLSPSIIGVNIENKI